MPYRGPMLVLRRPTRVLVTVLALVVVVHLGALLAGASRLADATQWTLMPLLAAALATQVPTPRGRLVTLTLLALGFSWLGDAAPDLFTGDTAFLVMVGFFLCAQVAYLVAFVPLAARGPLRRRPVLVLPYVGVVVLLVVLCAPGAGSLLVPVLVYGVCLGAMAALSSGVDAVAWAGGALFLVSDGLIALDAFVPSLALPGQGFWVMLTYIAAQVLIVTGVLRRQSGLGTTAATPDGQGVESALGRPA